MKCSSTSPVAEVRRVALSPSLLEAAGVLAKDPEVPVVRDGMINHSRGVM